MSAFLRAQQLREALVARDELIVLLSLPNPDHETRAFFRQLDPDCALLKGSPTGWIELAQELNKNPSFMGKLPEEGHLFISAVVQMQAPLLHSLLFDLRLDPESYTMPLDEDRVWTVWTWIASLLWDDAVARTPSVAPLRQKCWEVLLPCLIAAGLDLEKQAPNSFRASLTRREWLHSQGPDEFEQALRDADRLVLLEQTAASSFNSERQRL